MHAGARSVPALRPGGASAGSQATGLPARMAALITLLSRGGWIAAILRSFLSNQPAFRACRAVLPQLDGGTGAVLRSSTTTDRRGPLLKRWPQLWKIVRGDFAWVGNRPLTRAQAAMLSNDFERSGSRLPSDWFHWLMQGCIDSISDEARAHASFYAVQHRGGSISRSWAARYHRGFLALSLRRKRKSCCFAAAFVVKDKV